MKRYPFAKNYGWVHQARISYLECMPSKIGGELWCTIDGGREKIRRIDNKLEGVTGVFYFSVLSFYNFASEFIILAMVAVRSV